MSLLVWTGVQAGAIAIAALRVPLWAQAPAAIEGLALPILLVAQITFLSLMSPRLLANWRSTAITVAAAWPFTVLASVLGASSSHVLLLGGAYLSGYALALRLARLPLSPTKGVFTLSALVSAWSVGGAVVGFVGMEYGSPPLSPPAPHHTLYLGPIMNGMAILNFAESAGHGPWLFLAALALGGCGVLVVKKAIYRAAGKVRRQRSD